MANTIAIVLKVMPNIIHFLELNPVINSPFFIMIDFFEINVNKIRQISEQNTRQHCQNLEYIHLSIQVCLNVKQQSYIQLV